jgi:hypothetical protein
MPVLRNPVSCGIMIDQGSAGTGPGGPCTVWPGRARPCPARGQYLTSRELILSLLSPFPSLYLYLCLLSLSALLFFFEQLWPSFLINNRLVIFFFDARFRRC